MEGRRAERGASLQGEDPPAVASKTGKAGSDQTETGRSSCPGPHVWRRSSRVPAVEYGQTAALLCEITSTSPALDMALPKRLNEKREGDLTSSSSGLVPADKALIESQAAAVVGACRRFRARRYPRMAHELRPRRIDRLPPTSLRHRRTVDGCLSPWRGHHRPSGGNPVIRHRLRSFRRRRAAYPAPPAVSGARCRRLPNDPPMQIDPKRIRQRHWPVRHAAPDAATPSDHEHINRAQRHPIQPSKVRYSVHAREMLVPHDFQTSLERRSANQIKPRGDCRFFGFLQPYRAKKADGIFEA